MAWRNITVDGESYRWSGHHYVVVQDGSGRRVCSGPAAFVKGISEDDWERGQRNRGSDGMMRPGDVAAFVKRSRTGSK